MDAPPCVFCLLKCCILQLYRSHGTLYWKTVNINVALTDRLCTFARQFHWILISRANNQPWKVTFEKKIAAGGQTAFPPFWPFFSTFLLPFSLTFISTAHPFKVPVSRPSPCSVILHASLTNRRLERENMGQGRGNRKSGHYFLPSLPPFSIRLHSHSAFVCRTF